MQHDDYNFQATRIAYGGATEFRRVVTLDGALFEKSGTMSGGGGKPRGGKMGTSIRAATVSGESISNAEKELATLVEKLNTVRQRISNAVRQYQTAEKEVTRMEMELAKSQREVCHCCFHGNPYYSEFFLKPEVVLEQNTIMTLLFEYSFPLNR